MNSRDVTLWETKSHEIVPATATSPAEITKYAVQLRKRDIRQIVEAFLSNHYEMASTFVWSRAITALKKQLTNLGSEFIGEMLQRPDIGAHSDILSAVTDSEAIALAEDLGIVSSTEALRLRHAHEVINHFSEFDVEFEEDDFEPAMNVEEAIGCLRNCVNSILGRQKLDVAQDFAEFRRQLEENTFSETDGEIVGLLKSPYFFRKTTLSVLMALLKTATGAQLEHSVRNTNVILPLIWNGLRKPEKWQAGQTYAELYADGKKSAVKGLRHTLSKVGGFDYVPENLRSSTFSKAAKEVLEAHQGMNNFYNEPGPMRALASLGTTIPGPAFAICMTAILCVWLGSSYGYSWAAQDGARKLFRGITNERWQYYVEEVLPSDREILVKLQQNKPTERWIELFQTVDAKLRVPSDRFIAQLLKETINENVTAINKISARLYNRNLKSSK